MSNLARLNYLQYSIKKDGQDPFRDQKFSLKAGWMRPEFLFSVPHYGSSPMRSVHIYDLKPCFEEITLYWNLTTQNL